MSGSATIRIAPLQPADRERWLELWSQYQQFYRVELSPEVTEATWLRIGDGRVRGLCARNAADYVVGIVHFLFHEDTWSTTRACYLEDLYVDPSARGSGCGRLLIEAVAEASKQAGANSPYWLTHQSNATARRLYDRLAQDPGFIQYIYTAGAGAPNAPD
jgi:ribosomal protein S18 acetylase RimI-like enzyme